MMMICFVSNINHAFFSSCDQLINYPLPTGTQLQGLAAVGLVPVTFVVVVRQRSRRLPREEH